MNRQSCVLLLTVISLVCFSSFGAAEKPVKDSDVDVGSKVGLSAAPIAKIGTKSVSPSESLFHSLTHGESGVRFFAGFVASTSMILVSEFGDKTFFIAAIMAMRHPRWEVFSSAIAALALMTVLSAAMGLSLPHILSPAVTHALSSVLFLFFGFRLLYDAYHMEPNVANLEELEEVESELEKKDNENNNNDIENMETGDSQRKTQSRTSALVRRFFSPVFIQCFIMTFLAEWGDRSQIATIALAAAKDPFGVTLGGICGHACCTGVAVLGGKLLATRISERSISMMGGILFLLFAIHSIFFDSVDAAA
jgi:putative Ca2+/H+ antiporter (TMEM165/GDT1 family)